MAEWLALLRPGPVVFREALITSGSLWQWAGCCGRETFCGGRIPQPRQEGKSCKASALPCPASYIHSLLPKLALPSIVSGVLCGARFPPPLFYRMTLTEPCTTSMASPRELLTPWHLEIRGIDGSTRVCRHVRLPSRMFKEPESE